MESLKKKLLLFFKLTGKNYCTATCAFEQL